MPVLIVFIFLDNESSKESRHSRYLRYCMLRQKEQKLINLLMVKHSS